MQVKVLSFNIAHGMGMDGVVDLERIAKIVEESDADIVGLQEVDRYFGMRSGFSNQIEWFENRLGMYSAYGANLDFEPLTAGGKRRQYGNAILSKHPIKYAENHQLTEVSTDFGSDERRGLLETIIDIDGNYIHFFNTHLSLKEEELIVNISEVLEITGRSRFPRILTGDFNAAPDNRVLQRMTRQFTDVFAALGKGNAYTYPAPYENAATGERLQPVTRIDYVFSDPNVAALSGEVIRTDSSDHQPIVAEVTIKKLVSRIAGEKVKSGS